MIRAAVLLLLLPAAALAQEAPEPGSEPAADAADPAAGAADSPQAAFMEGCMQASGGAEPSAFCQCMADRMLPTDGTPPDPDPMAAMAACDPDLAGLLDQ